MRRLAAIAAIACLLAPFLVSPVAAQINVNVLTTTVEVGASRTPPSVDFSSPNLLCKTGYSSGTEFRCAFEFDLSSILSDAKITAATLSILRTAGCSTNDCEVGIRSYKGDGSADVTDLIASSTNFAVWKPNTVAKNVNVLSQILAHRNNSEPWAGFILVGVASTKTLDVQRFSVSSTDLTLSISYIPNPVDVTVVKDGNGTGKVVSSIPGINCGSTCTGTFTYEEPVTLTASTVGSNMFVTWSGIPCNEGNQTTTCTFNVPSVPDPIHATFTSTATPVPFSTPTPRPTAKPTGKPAASHAATQAPPTGAPTAAPTTDQRPIVTFAPGETVGPTLGTTDSTPDASGGGVPIGVIVLIGGIVLGIAIGVGAYLYARRRQGMAPPGM